MHPLFLLFAFCTLSSFGQSDTIPPENAGFHVIASGPVFTNPPFQSCHAATIAEVGRDTLLYAWFGGDHEGAKNVAIWGCFRYTKQKDQWSKTIQLANGRDSNGSAQACWNPVLFKSPAGALFLYYKVGANPRQWRAERKISYDNGRTWLPPNRLNSPYLGPIKNKPVQVGSELILYPSSTESLDGKTWQIHLESTDAAGNNWQYIPIDCGSLDVIQPAILKYRGDSLQLLCRSKQNTIVQTWSFDNGKSWSALLRLNLPNPNAGIDAVTLSNGWQLLVYNPMTANKDWWAGRSILKVALSKNGYDWKDIVTLENHKNGEYSYPAVIQDSRNVIRIAYTNNRESIKFVDIEQIK